MENPNMNSQPPQYMPPVPNAPTGHGNEGRLVVLGAVVVLLAIAAFILLKSDKAPVDEGTQNLVSDQPAEGVEVERADISASSGEKLPEGFPSNIPVDTTDVTESYKAEYTQYGVTQYTVSFKSSKTKAELWKQYSDFLKSAGYTVNTAVTSQASGVVMGSKDKSELNVVVTTPGSFSYVTINYSERK